MKRGYDYWTTCSTEAQNGPGSSGTPETPGTVLQAAEARARPLQRWERSRRYRLIVRLLSVAGLGLSVAAEPAAVPRALGAGTGGMGAWSCSAAAHSPSRIAVDPSAGPEQTPAAVLEFSFSATEYNWNWATTATGDLDVSQFCAVRLTYRTEVPAGPSALSVMVRESTGAAYWVPRALPLSPARYRCEVVPFSRFTVPAWSSDANGRLDLDLVTELSVGLETGRGGRGRVLISDVELLPVGW